MAALDTCDQDDEEQDELDRCRLSKVDGTWQTRRESRVIMNCMFRRKARIQFGLLESLTPASSLAKIPTTYHCRLLLYGKAGVGKTSTASKLCGRLVPKTHVETLGIHTSVTYWPAKLTNPPTTLDQIVLLQLEMWDTGERTLRKYEHVLPSMLSSTNTIAFFFSYTDRSSWKELPGIIEQAKLAGKTGSHLKIVVGTRLDSAQVKVTREEIVAFEKKHDIRVLSVANVNRVLLPVGWPDGVLELPDIMSFLNELTELVMDHQKVDSSGGAIDGLVSKTSTLDIS